MKQNLKKINLLNSDETIESNSSNEYTETEQIGCGGLKSIVYTDYIKSRNGSIQDNLTKREIYEKLQGYREIKDRRLLKFIPVKTYIKYYNKYLKKFRTGGILLKLTDKYIMLANIGLNLIWSVQLNENRLFIDKEIYNELIEEYSQKEKIEKEELLKNKLYRLYKNGKLTLHK